MREHPESGMQNVVLWHVLLCACFSRTSPPLRPTAPPQRSWGREPSASARQGSRAFCIRTSCAHASCSRSSDTRLPHAHLHHPSSPPGSSIQSLACKMSCYGTTFCVPAVLTGHHRKDPLLHPSAPPPGVERLLRQRVMRRPIMQTDFRHRASSRTPPSPLFPTRLRHPKSGMQTIVL